MSDRNVIPEFTSDPESIAVSLRVAKDVLEGLTGQRRGEGVGSPRMFVQITRPDPRVGVTLKLGDLWIHPTDRKLYFWDGRLWQSIVP